MESRINEEHNDLKKLYFACWEGEVNYVRELINNSIDVNSLLDADYLPTLDCKNGRSFLFAAVENGQLEIVNLLIESGVDVELKSLGRFPLSHAIDSFVQAEINYSCVDVCGRTIVKCLLAAGADLDRVDSSGTSARNLLSQYNLSIDAVVSKYSDDDKRSQE